MQYGGLGRGRKGGLDVCVAGEDGDSDGGGWRRGPGVLLGGANNQKDSWRQPGRGGGWSMVWGFSREARMPGEPRCKPEGEATALPLTARSLDLSRAGAAEVHEALKG